jgi:membrane associated rhomboid family serine protease
VFVVLPAWVIAGLFFVQNLGMALLASVDSARGMAESGIAFVAHLGGFGAGMLLVKPLLRGTRVQTHVWQGFRPSERPPRPRVTRR